MTVEELEIIIRANVTDAVGGLKNITNAVKKCVSDSIKPMEQIKKETKKVAADLAPMVKETEKSMAEYTKVVKSAVEEVQDVIDDVKIDFSGAFDHMSIKELEKEYDYVSKLISMWSDDVFKGVKNRSGTGFHVEVTGTEEELKILEELRDRSYELFNAIDKNKPKLNIDTTEAKQELYTLDERLKDFKFLTLREQISTVGEQIRAQIPHAKEFGDGVRAALQNANELIQPLTSKFSGLFNGIKSGTEKVKHAFNVLKNEANGVFKKAKAEAKPYLDVLKNVGTVGKNAFTEASIAIKNKTAGIRKGISRVREFIKNLRSSETIAKSAGKNGKKMGADFERGLKKALKTTKKFVLSLFGIQGAYRAVSRAASAYMQYDQALQESTQNSWRVLGSLLAPVLELVANLFAKAVSYVHAFVQALTGVNLVARANAKALDNQAKATKRAGAASQGLIGIDDLNNLSSDSSGSDLPTITVDPIDPSAFDGLMPIFKKLKEVIKDIFTPMKNAWQNYGQGFVDSFKNAFSSIGDLGQSIFGSIMEVWTNGTGQTIVEELLKGWTLVFDIIGGIADAITNAWNNAGRGTSIIQKVADIFISIQKLTNSIMETLKIWYMSPAFTKALELTFEVIDDILTWVKDLAGWFVTMWDKYVKPVLEDSLIPALEVVVDMFRLIWQIAKPIIDELVKHFKNILEPAIEGATKVLGAIIDVARGILEFFLGVFTGDWRKAWQGITRIVTGVWDGILALFTAGGKIFLGVVEGIAGVFKTIVNTLIRGINNIIKIPFDLINGMLNRIRNTSFLGISPFKSLWSQNPIPVPKIPQLASGHVASSPLIAEIGEYANAKSNPEIVSPVSLMAETFRKVMSEFADSMGGQRFDRLVVNFMNQNFFDEVIDEINEQAHLKGVSIIKR